MFRNLIACSHSASSPSYVSMIVIMIGSAALLGFLFWWMAGAVSKRPGLMTGRHAGLAFLFGSIATAVLSVFGYGLAASGAMVIRDVCVPHPLMAVCGVVCIGCASIILFGLHCLREMKRTDNNPTVMTL